MSPTVEGEIDFFYFLKLGEPLWLTTKGNQKQISHKNVIYTKNVHIYNKLNKKCFNDQMHHFLDEFWKNNQPQEKNHYERIIIEHFPRKMLWYTTEFENGPHKS